MLGFQTACFQGSFIVLSQHGRPTCVLTSASLSEGTWRQWVWLPTCVGTPAVGLEGNTWCLRSGCGRQKAVSEALLRRAVPRSSPPQENPWAPPETPFSGWASPLSQPTEPGSLLVGQSMITLLKVPWLICAVRFASHCSLRVSLLSSHRDPVGLPTSLLISSVTYEFCSITGDFPSYQGPVSIFPLPQDLPSLTLSSPLNLVYSLGLNGAGDTFFECCLVFLSSFTTLLSCSLLWTCDYWLAWLPY